MPGNLLDKCHILTRGPHPGVNSGFSEDDAPGWLPVVPPPCCSHALLGTHCHTLRGEWLPPRLFLRRPDPAARHCGCPCCCITSSQQAHNRVTIGVPGVDNLLHACSTPLLAAPWPLPVQLMCAVRARTLSLLPIGSHRPVIYSFCSNPRRPPCPSQPLPISPDAPLLI
jgi:hypothetical protein